MGVMRAPGVLVFLAVLAYMLTAEARTFTREGRDLQQMASPPMPAGIDPLQLVYQPRCLDLADDTYLTSPIPIDKQSTRRSCDVQIRWYPHRLSRLLRHT